MKNNARYFLIISSFLFWIAFTTISMPTIIIFSLFGLGIGFLIAKAMPLTQLTWPKGFRKPLLILLSAALSVVTCVCSARFFHNSWQNSAVLKSIVTRFIPDFEVALVGISVVLGFGMLPSVFDVCCRGLYHIYEFFLSIEWSFLWKHTKSNLSLKSSLKGAATAIIGLLLSASIGIGLLTAVFCIPVDSIDKHVAQSAQTIYNEGTYPCLSTWFHSQLDNWTDSIILMEAAKGRDTNALEAAANASHGLVADAATPAEVLTAHYIDGKPYASFSEYCRYWHGYLILIKPLLCFMDFSAIRALNGVIQLLLIGVLCLLLKKRGLKEYIIPFLLIYLMLMPVALACSMQFSNCFYVIIIGIIGMLLIKEEKLDRYVAPLFLAIGIGTAYFDFFTYPIATFGLPALMLLVLQRSKSLEEKLFQIVKCGIFWCIGFGGMWASKWIISRVVLGYSFSRILTAISRWSTITNNAPPARLFCVEAANYTTFLQTPVALLALLFIGVKYLKLRKDASVTRKQTYRTVLPYLLVGLAPIVWYAFATTHSSVHYWFTSKACAVTLLGILFAIVNIYTLQIKEPTESADT